MDKLLDKIWRFFSSVKLAIVLILIIIATAIIGTVIQQGLPDEMYIKHYGLSVFNVLNSFDLFDMYHSWWFELLLILFIVNVIVCTWERLPAIFKMFSNPKLKLPVEKLNAFKEKATIPYNGDRETLIKNLTGRLQEIYKAPIHNDSKEGDFLYLEKGRIARFGPYITHISLIIIFIGVLIGSFFGFESYVNLVPGDSTNIVRTLRGNKEIKLPFSIKCNHFNVEFYNSGMPKAYKSDLSIISDDNVVAQKVIDVNKPLTYKGITIYQASYGQAGASNFDLVLTNAHKGDNDISLNLNEPYHVSDNTQ
jgi:cytochrome c biogenesis protein